MNTAALMSNLWMFVAGAVLFVLGWLLYRRTSRYDLKGAAIDSAMDVARGRRSAGNPTEIERRLQDIASRKTSAGKVTAAASTVVGHFAAQFFGVAAILMMLAGAALIALGVFWT